MDLDMTEINNLLVKENKTENNNVTKNSVALTVPITFFVGISVFNKLPVVIGPHPPPPIASKNDATKPKILI